MAKGDLREKFLEGWGLYGFPGSDATEEYPFHPERRWRFDVAFPAFQVAVELDGFGFGHQSIAGRKADNEKANAAVELGWFILRYTSNNLTRTQMQDTVEQVKRVILARATK